MPKLLSGYIAKQIAKQLGKHMLSATLIKVAAGTRTPGAVSAGAQATQTSYACRGFVSDYDQDAVDGTNVKQDDREITLLGGTIASGQVPAKNDRITIADKAGGAQVTYMVIRVTSDPDGATYTCQARK